MKPSTSQAMQDLIQQVREAIPFDVPEADVCSGICRGCAKKLMVFIDGELEYWELSLDRGERPLLGDLNTLAKRSKKVFAALKKNNLV